MHNCPSKIIVASRERATLCQTAEEITTLEVGPLSPLDAAVLLFRTGRGKTGKSYAGLKGLIEKMKKKEERALRTLAAAEPPGLSGHPAGTLFINLLVCGLGSLCVLNRYSNGGCDTGLACTEQSNPAVSNRDYRGLYF